MVSRLLPALVPFLLMGCFGPVERRSEMGGEFPLADTTPIQIGLDEGDYAEWTWSSEVPVSFEVWEAVGIDANQTRGLVKAGNGTADDGRFTATRLSELQLVWRVLGPETNVTYHVETTGSLPLFHF